MDTCARGIIVNFNTKNCVGRTDQMFSGFSGFRSDSMALSHVWLGHPGGRFQSDGGLRIAAATARWWSSSGALRAMCSQRISSVAVVPWWKVGDTVTLPWLLHLLYNECKNLRDLAESPSIRLRYVDRYLFTIVSYLIGVFVFATIVGMSSSSSSFVY